MSGDIHFDTNIVVDALNRCSPAIAELRRAGRPWISRISWIDVMTGAPAAARTETEAFLSNFSICELTAEIARRAVNLRAERRSLRLPDAIILASAQSSGAILVTRNSRDFPANMPGIRIPYQL